MTTMLEPGWTADALHICLTQGRHEQHVPNGDPMLQPVS